MNLKNIIKEILFNTLCIMNVDIDINDINVEIPKQKDNGDFATNISLKLCKILKTNPMELASKIKDNIDNELFENIEVASPGFINFKLNREYVFNGIS